MGVMMVVAVTGFALLSAVVSVMIAAGKRRRPWLWGPVGLLFNLPGMLLVTLLPAALPRELRGPVTLWRRERAERHERVAV